MFVKRISNTNYVLGNSFLMFAQELNKKVLLEGQRGQM